jgi:hypothetical protein
MARVTGCGRGYPVGRKVSDDEMEELALTRDDFHGDWNYSLTPRLKGSGK